MADKIYRSENPDHKSTDVDETMEMIKDLREKREKEKPIRRRKVKRDQEM